MAGFSGETGRLPGTGEEHEQPEIAGDSSKPEQPGAAEISIEKVFFAGREFNLRRRSDGEEVAGYNIQMTNHSVKLNDPFVTHRDPGLTFVPAAYSGPGECVATHVLENGHSVIVAYTQQGETYNAGVYIDDGAECVDSDPRFTQNKLDMKVTQAIAEAEALPSLKK